MLRWSNQPWTRGSRHCEANEPEAAAQRAGASRGGTGSGAGLEAGYGSLCRLRSRVRIWFGSLARFSMLILSTGANKGIGSEVARQLAASGCTVLVGSRNKLAVTKPQPSSKAKAARSAI